MAEDEGVDTKPATTKAAPKNHHYVPRFYLAQFANKQAGDNIASLWMFSRGQTNPKRIPPVQIARVHQYYSFPSEGGYDIEPELAFGEIETRAALIFERFKRGEYILTPDEKDDFSYFVALMLVRIPADRADVEASFRPKIEQFKERFPQKYEARMMEFALDCGTTEEKVLTQKLAAAYSLESAISDIPKLATLLKAHNWFIRKAPRGYSFITSDRPALYHPNTKDHPLGYVSMPLSPMLHFSAKPNMALFCRLRSSHAAKTEHELLMGVRQAEPNIRVTTAERDHVRYANHKIIDHALKYIFTSSLDAPLEREIRRRVI